MITITLSQQSLPSLDSNLSIPTYDRNAIKHGIIHIGVGGFHRSHQAYYIHQLLSKYKDLDWGVCGIGLRESDRKISNVFTEQDCLYTLIIQHPNGVDDCEVIGSITDYVLATDAPQDAINKMAHPDTKIVSLTITEGGYNFSSSTGKFDFDNPDVQHDLQNPAQPKTVFGYLTASLRKRREQDLAAFTILSCDNIQHNGNVAKQMLLSFAKKQDKDLADWIAQKVCFPNTMVDRITPVTSEPAMKLLEENYNLQDEWPVVCEPYIQWVIEDNFSNGRPPLEKLGVQFVPDVTPYEKMKIRLLNAGHSVLAIPGALHGHPTINACMEDEVFSTFMRQFMDQEATPVLGTIEGMNLTDYKNSLEERFSNPNIKDSVSRICSETSAKLPKFLIPTIIENLESGGSIKYGTFILAAWCYYSAKGVDFNNEPLEIIDARKAELHKAAEQYQEDKLSFLNISDVFGELKSNERFVAEYTRLTHAIYTSMDVRSIMSSISADKGTL